MCFCLDTPALTNYYCKINPKPLCGLCALPAHSESVLSLLLPTMLAYHHTSDSFIWKVRRTGVNITPQTTHIKMAVWAQLLPTYFIWLSSYSTACMCSLQMFSHLDISVPIQAGGLIGAGLDSPSLQEMKEVTEEKGGKEEEEVVEVSEVEEEKEEGEGTDLNSLQRSLMPSWMPTMLRYLVSLTLL